MPLLWLEGCWHSSSQLYFCSGDSELKILVSANRCVCLAQAIRIAIFTELAAVSRFPG